MNSIFSRTLIFSLLVLATHFTALGQVGRFVSTVNTLADLAALNPATIYTNVFVAGYSTANDGGQGDFTYVSSATTTTNRGTVIKPTGGTGRWLRQYSGDLNVLWFGAKGDGSTDDTAAIQNAIDTANSLGGGKVFFPAKDPTSNGYIVASNITQKNNVIISGESDTGSSITFTANNPSGDIYWNLTGCNTGGIENMRFRIHSGTTPAGDTILYVRNSVAGLWMRDISIDGNSKNVSGLRLSADGVLTVRSFVGMNIRVVACTSGVILDGGIGNCNVNKFYQLKVTGCSSLGLQLLQVDANEFFGVWLEENGTQLDLNACEDNQVYGYIEPDAGQTGVAINGASLRNIVLGRLVDDVGTWPSDAVILSSKTTISPRSKGATYFSNIYGTLTVPNGGTGAATLTGILYGNGTGAVTAGNGTANRVAKFSAASPGVANSTITDNGTDISTAQPGSFLIGLSNSGSGYKTAILSGQKLGWSDAGGTARAWIGGSISAGGDLKAATEGNANFTLDVGSGLILLNTSESVQSTGNFITTVAGKGIQIKSGANARIGTATLVGGTVTVANTSVGANTKIFLSRATTGGTAGHLSYTTTAATSFTINSSSGTDTSTIDWLLVEAVP